MEPLPPGGRALHAVGFPDGRTHLDVKHFAATPVGLRVRAHAELVKVDGAR